MALSLFAAVPAGASVADDVSTTEDQETADEAVCYDVDTPTGGHHQGCIGAGDCGGGGQEGGITYYYRCVL